MKETLVGRSPYGLMGKESKVKWLSPYLLLTWRDVLEERRQLRRRQLMPKLKVGKKKKDELRQSSMTDPLINGWESLS